MANIVFMIQNPGRVAGADDTRPGVFFSNSFCENPEFLSIAKG